MQPGQWMPSTTGVPPVARLQNHFFDTLKEEVFMNTHAPTPQPAPPSPEKQTVAAEPPSVPLAPAASGSPACKKPTMPASPCATKPMIPASPSAEKQAVPATSTGSSTKQAAASYEMLLLQPQALRTDVPADATEKQIQNMWSMLVGANAVRQLAAPIVLEATCGSPWKETLKSSFIGQHDLMLRDSGRPTDPVEVMLLEQILVAFHHSLELQRRMMTVDSLDGVKIYGNAVSSLLGEFRRLTGALQNYRSPRRKKQFVVVKQQNLASGNQQIALVDGTQTAPSSLKLPKNDSSTELNGSQPLAISHQPAKTLLPEPQEGSRREAELVKARPVDGRKQSKTPRRNPKKQTLDVLDRSENT